MFSALTKQLIEALQQLPGVGPKSAQRLAFFLLSEKGRTKGLKLSEALKSALSQVHECKRCRLYTEKEFCDICQNPKRNPHLLCVVETPIDVIALEQTSSYQGLYFVLQGHLSPLDNMGPAEIGFPLLFKRLETEPIEELIIATNPTVEGEATAHYISTHIDPKIKCTRIAYGVPIGGELEYLDGYTLRHALGARIPIERTNENK